MEQILFRQNKNFIITAACDNIIDCPYRRMDLSKWKYIDPHLLVGLVNTELRNHSESLEDLVKTHDLSEEDLKRKLAEVGYAYRPEQNRFR
jgi:hypothetical protein